MDPIIKKSIIEYVLGQRAELSITGSPRMVATIYEAAIASRSLLQLLKNEQDLNKINEAIERRKTAAKRFAEITGSEWDI